MCVPTILAVWFPLSLTEGSVVVIIPKLSTKSRERQSTCEKYMENQVGQDHSNLLALDYNAVKDTFLSLEQ